MARLVRHEAQGPYKVEASDKDQYVCACGLSQNKPFCDGSHKATLDEDEASLYRYAGDVRDGARRVVEA